MKKKNIKFADLKILKHEILWYISYNYYSSNGFRNILILGGEHVCYLTLTVRKLSFKTTLF